MIYQYVFSYLSVSIMVSFVHTDKMLTTLLIICISCLKHIFIDK